MLRARRHMAGCKTSQKFRRGKIATPPLGCTASLALLALYPGAFARATLGSTLARLHIGN